MQKLLSAKGSKCLHTIVLVQGNIKVSWTLLQMQDQSICDVNRPPPQKSLCSFNMSKEISKSYVTDNETGNSNCVLFGISGSSPSQFASLCLNPGDNSPSDKKFSPTSKVRIFSFCNFLYSAVSLLPCYEFLSLVLVFEYI